MLMTAVTITQAPLEIENLLAVVDGAPVKLDEATRARIAASRAVVDESLRCGEAVYGLTTNVGHGRDTRLDEEQIRSGQQFLIMSHGGGLGRPLRTAVVRAALAVRLNGIARGGSGAALAVADTIAAMLNAGVHPIVPETASVGASDIGQMACMAQVAIGAGRAEYCGEVLAGGEAMRRAGIAPLALGGKDGLALMSANGVSVGHGALVIVRAERTARAADLAASLSMEATGANVSIVDPAVARSVQDALSFRVVPQVHGALREYVAAARAAVSMELNAACDNPLVARPERALVSNGNFQPVVMAIAFDALRITLAHAGQLSDRRMTHLWDAFFRQLSSGPPPAVAYGLQVRYPAAARYAELRQLAAPATLDTPPLDLGVEDHGTGAPLSVCKADAALGALEDVLACELLLARDLLTGADAKLGSGTKAALQLIEEAIAAAEPHPDAVHKALRDRFPDRH